MKKSLALAASLLAAVAFAGPVAARDLTVGAIKIEQPWTRATPGGAKVAGGFVRITNTGSTPDTLVKVTSGIAGVVELHEMKMVDGVMKMRALGSGIALAPGQTVELKPGGYHLMFIGLKQPVVQGKPVKAKLVFQKAGEVEVEFDVAPIGAPSMPKGGGHHKH